MYCFNEGFRDCLRVITAVTRLLDESCAAQPVSCAGRWGLDDLCIAKPIQFFFLLSPAQCTLCGWVCAIHKCSEASSKCRSGRCLQGASWHDARHVALPG